MLLFCWDLQGLTDEDADRINLELNPQPRELEVTCKSFCIGHGHRTQKVRAEQGLTGAGS